MSSLSPDGRRVLALASMGGLTTAAIAALVGLPVETVGLLLEEARNEVANRLVA